MSIVFSSALDTAKVRRVPIKPITRGYDFTFSFKFTGPNGATLSSLNLMNATRVFGQFRSGPRNDATLLASIDTADDTIQVVAADKISFVVAANLTRTMPDKVWVDFARLDAGLWLPIPILVAWPVKNAITVPPV